jgi:hypothetical protein
MLDICDAFLAFDLQLMRSECWFPKRGRSVGAILIWADRWLLTAMRCDRVEGKGTGLTYRPCGMGYINGSPVFDELGE